MLPRQLLAAFATTVVCASITASAAAQQAPTPPPPAGPGAQPAAPGGSWGTGIPSPQPGTPPPGAYPQGPYPQGPYPQGPYPQPGAYPPGAYPGGYPGGYAQPGQGSEPTTMGPDGRIHSLPLELPYDADKGIPAGYKVSEKPRYNMAIAGGSVFGGLWVASCIAGGFMEDSGKYNGTHGWPMYIPAVGPFITIASSKSSSAGTTALLFDGIGEIAGIGMFIAGMASSQKILKYQFNTASTEITLKPMASPMQNGGFAGLTGTF